MPQRDGAVTAAAARRRRTFAANARRRAGLRLSNSWAHDRAGRIRWRDKRPENPLLTLRELGFSEKDLDLQCFIEILPRQPADDTARNDRGAGKNLRGSDRLGVHAHPEHADPELGAASRLESRPHKHATHARCRWRCCERCSEAEPFEIFLHTRYVGQKRFSLQGAESLMVILDTILHKCPARGVEEICMGMAHRGRLNVARKFSAANRSRLSSPSSARITFPNLVAGDGDVKYHLGYRTGPQTRLRRGSRNPALGQSEPSRSGRSGGRRTRRARRQRIRGDTEHRRKVLPLLIHGDAAFAGQGIVAETLNMSQLPGYSTGGTVHVVVNNQIGFTTLPRKARVVDVCHRRRQDDRGADFPRERRRSAGGASS